MTDHHIDLEYRPRDWQALVHKSKKQRNVIVSHRRSGKTVLAIMELIDCALSCKKQDGRFVYIAPYRTQAKDISWSYLRKYGTKIPHTKVSETELFVEFANGARIRCYGSDNEDAMRGLYIDGAVVDELADVSKEFLDTVLMPCLADRDGWLILMGTPKGTDQLSQSYYMHKDDPEWYCVKLDINTTKALTESQLKILRSSMTEGAWQQEMMCDFSATTPDVLLCGADVEAAMLRQLKPTEYAMAAVVLGVDVARFGDDRTVITRRQGLQVFPPIVMRGANSIEVARRLMKEIDDHAPEAVFIDGTGGFGGGVADQCRQYGYHIIEVHFNGSPLDARFKNCRAEMWFGMATWVKNGGALPPVPEYRAEMTGPRYKHDQGGKLQLEPKEDVKGRGLPSPDLADSLALTFYSQVMPSRDRYGREVYTNRTSNDHPKDAFYE